MACWEGAHCPHKERPVQPCSQLISAESCLPDNFALVGPGGTGEGEVVVRESMNLFHVHASGRRFCKVRLGHGKGRCLAGRQFPRPAHPWMDPPCHVPADPAGKFSPEEAAGPAGVGHHRRHRHAGHARHPGTCWGLDGDRVRGAAPDFQAHARSAGPAVWLAWDGGGSESVVQSGEGVPLRGAPAVAQVAMQSNAMPDLVLLIARKSAARSLAKSNADIKVSPWRLLNGQGGLC